MNNELREKIIELALLQYHKKYAHGEKGPDTFDCAGLVKYIYKEVLGINVFEKGYGKSTTGKIMTSPKGELIEYEENSEDKDISLIEPGDVLLFHRQDKDADKTEPTNKYPGHCGIYLGDGVFIHATTREESIKRIIGEEKYNELLEENNGAKPGLVIKSKLKRGKLWYKKLVGVKKYTVKR